MRTEWLLVFLIVSTLRASAAMTPILFIPGLTGSQLWGTVENTEPCNSDTPRLLWVAFRTLLCISTLELRYDQNTSTYSDMEGVNVSVPGFGDTSSVECLEDNTILCDTIPRLRIYRTFVDYFVARGYQRGVTIRAAPYDWRLAAESHATRGYFTRLRLLVEEMYNQTGKPVALIVHSMGGPMSLYFLNEVVTPEWKDKYIKVYIPLSGAFGGASEPVEAVVSGLYHLDFIPKLEFETTLLNIQRSFESLYWLMPRAEIYKDQILVKTPNTNYSAGDYQPMFTTFANYPLGWTKYMPTSSINAGYIYPGVPTHCFYGSEVDTPLTYVYSSNDPTQRPTIIKGSGDGTVNKVGLEVCLRWANSTNGTGFQSRAFPGVVHDNMVTNTEVLNAIGEIVMAGPPSSSVIARVNIYSTMVLLAAAFISRKAM